MRKFDALRPVVVDSVYLPGPEGKPRPHKVSIIMIGEGEAIDVSDIANDDQKLIAKVKELVR